MTGETLWNTIIAGLSSEDEEIQTTTGLWFRASSNDGRLYVDKATAHTPSSNLSMQRAYQRKISYMYSRIMSGGLKEKLV